MVLVTLALSANVPPNHQSFEFGELGYEFQLVPSILIEKSVFAGAAKRVCHTTPAFKFLTANIV